MHVPLTTALIHAGPTTYIAVYAGQTHPDTGHQLCLDGGPAPRHTAAGAAVSGQRLDANWVNQLCALAGVDPF